LRGNGNFGQRSTAGYFHSEHVSPDAAAEEADLVQRSVVRDLRARDLAHYGVLCANRWRRSGRRCVSYKSLSYLIGKISQSAPEKVEQPMK
jgi:hypothetical protein